MEARIPQVFRRIRGGHALGGILLGVVLLLWGCRAPSPCEERGYTHLRGETYCKLVELGEADCPPKPGDYLSVELRYYTWDDSLFFNATRRFQLEESSYPGSIDDCLGRLSPGDSASFYLNPNLFFGQTLASTRPHFLDSSQSMRIDVRLLGVEDSITYAREKEAFVHWIEDFSEYERVILRRYLLKHKIAAQPVDSVYYLPVQPGHGEYPQNGDTLTIEFVGRFLDGKFFDSTKRRGEPFVFVLGQTWQVIEGLERAIRRMRVGEHAIFILPSCIAFGQSGSSTGIVPPYTPVIFEVEFASLRPGKRGPSTHTPSGEEV